MNPNANKSVEEIVAEMESIMAELEKQTASWSTEDVLIMESHEQVAERETAALMARLMRK